MWKFLERPHLTIRLSVLLLVMTAYATWIRGTLCARIELSCQLGRVFAKLRPLKIDRCSTQRLARNRITRASLRERYELRVSFIRNGPTRENKEVRDESS